MGSQTPQTTRFPTPFLLEAALQQTSMETLSVMPVNNLWRDWPPFVLLQEVTRLPGRWWWGWPLAAGSTSLLWATMLSHQNKEPALTLLARRVDGGGTTPLERRALLSRLTSLQGSTPCSAQKESYSQEDTASTTCPLLRTAPRSST